MYLEAQVQREKLEAKQAKKELKSFVVPNSTEIVVY
jgi:hypothetical protein